MGGRIVVCVYDDPRTEALPGEDNTSGKDDNLTSEGLVLHNPDASYAISELKPMLTNFVYPAGMPAALDVSVKYSETEQMKIYEIPKTDYIITYSGGNWSQQRIPVISVKQNSVFDMRGLPIMTVKRERNWVRSDGGFFGKGEVLKGVSYDLSYLIPWQDATVYYTTDKFNQFASYTALEGGIAAIDTSAATNCRYRIQTTIDFGSQKVPVTVYLDITPNND